MLNWKSVDSLSTIRNICTTSICSHTFYDLFFTCNNFAYQFICVFVNMCTHVIVYLRTVLCLFVWYCIFVFLFINVYKWFRVSLVGSIKNQFNAFKKTWLSVCAWNFTHEKTEKYMKSFDTQSDWQLYTQLVCIPKFVLG